MIIDAYLNSILKLFKTLKLLFHICKNFGWCRVESFGKLKYCNQCRLFFTIFEEGYEASVQAAYFRELLLRKIGCLSEGFYNLPECFFNRQVRLLNEET